MVDISNYIMVVRNQLITTGCTTLYLAYSFHWVILHSVGTEDFELNIPKSTGFRRTFHGGIGGIIRILT